MFYYLKRKKVTCPNKLLNYGKIYESGWRQDLREIKKILRTVFVKREIEQGLGSVFIKHSERRKVLTRKKKLL
jgi:hypothetical protein